MKIVVLGCKGQLGRCLTDHLKKTDHEVLYHSRETNDITQFKLAQKKITEFNPNLVINAVAYTAVDKAENNEELASLVNHHAVKNIANICKKLDCWFIHISTDYVFDGDSNVPYKEDDIKNPRCIYGKTKLEGEKSIELSGCKYLIIRTAWVFSEYGNNFLKTMLDLGSKNEELSIVRDQIGCPTYAQDIAKSIVAIIPQLDEKHELQGIYHYCGDEPCSWYEFAEAIFTEAGIHDFKTPVSLIPINTADFPTAATRPLYSVLDCSKIRLNFGVIVSNWRYGIKKIISQK